MASRLALGLLCQVHTALGIRTSVVQSPEVSEAASGVSKFVHVPEGIHRLSIRDWKRQHPGWNVQTLKEDDVRSLISHHYSWFLQTYDGLETEEMRMDAARYAFLHRFGGISASAKSLPSTDVGALLESNDIVLSQDGCMISSQLMASAPNHGFWLSALLSVQKLRKLRSTSAPAAVQASCTTGGLMLGKLWETKFGDSSRPACTTRLHQRSPAYANTTFSLLSEDDSRDMLGLTRQDPGVLSEAAQESDARCRESFPGWGDVFGPEPIPKILHIAFDTGNGGPLPPLITQNIDTWMQQHPTWSLQLWNEEKMAKLLEDHYPWFLETWRGLPSRIMRLDSIRYAFLHHFGGVYADADTNASRPIDQFIEGNDLVLASYACHVVNYFFASRPGHPFWLHALTAIEHIHQNHADTDMKGPKQVLCTTGFGMLQKVWDQKMQGWMPKNCGTALYSTFHGEGGVYSILSKRTVEDVLGITHQRKTLWRGNITQKLAPSLLQTSSETDDSSCPDI